MASDPYCAAAPSRSTSMRASAAAGRLRRSVPPVPYPITPSSTRSHAMLCRRLPLTSTSVWSGASPRKVAALWAAPSPTDSLE